MNSPIVILAVIVLAALLAWVLRSINRGAETAADESGGPGREPAEADPESSDEEEIEVALTSDGEALIPFAGSLRVVLLVDPAQIEEHRDDIAAGVVSLDGEARERLAHARSGATIQVGDFTAMRVRRGRPDVAPWLVETLGRDGDYGFLPFESEEGARAALALIEGAGIVRRPLDEEGRAIPPSPEDFEEGLRRYEQTERELALGDPDEPRPEGWSSRR